MWGLSPGMEHLIHCLTARALIISRPKLHHGTQACFVCVVSDGICMMGFRSPCECYTSCSIPSFVHFIVGFAFRPFPPTIGRSPMWSTPANISNSFQPPTERAPAFPAASTPPVHLSALGQPTSMSLFDGAARSGPGSFIPPAYPSSRASLPSTSVSPINAFSIPSSVAANVSQQRRASAARTLPQHQVPSGTQSIHPRRASSRSPYPSSVRPTPTGQSSHVGVSSLMVDVALLPFTVCCHLVLSAFLHCSLSVSQFKAEYQTAGIPIPSVSFEHEDDLPDLLHVLRTHNLLFSITLSYSGSEPVWPKLSDGVTAHLDAHHLILPNDPRVSNTSLSGADVPLYHRASWILLEKKKSNPRRPGVAQLHFDHNRTGPQLDAATLDKIGRMINHPSEQRPLLFIGVLRTSCL